MKFKDVLYGGNDKECDLGGITFYNVTYDDFKERVKHKFLDKMEPKLLYKDTEFLGSCLYGRPEPQTTRTVPKTSSKKTPTIITDGMFRDDLYKLGYKVLSEDRQRVEQVIVDILVTTEIEKEKKKGKSKKKRGNNNNTTASALTDSEVLIKVVLLTPVCKAEPVTKKRGNNEPVDRLLDYNTVVKQFDVDAPGVGNRRVSYGDIMHALMDAAYDAKEYTSSKTANESIVGQNSGLYYQHASNSYVVQHITSTEQLWGIMSL